LAVIGGHRNAQTGIDEEKLQGILNRILQAVPAGAGAPGLPTPAAHLPRPLEAAPVELEEVEELAEEAETLEELDEAEAVEELAEAEELDEAEAVEELAEAEELEEEAEALEELAEVEELDEAETVEELAEAEEPEEEAEALEELAEVEELDEAEAVEELAEAEELDEAEALEELTEAEELDEAETVEELAEEKNAAGLLAAAAEKIDFEKKKPDVRLAFGDDDIPYIVETSGLEMVDEDIDSVLNMTRPDDEPAELEELEELDEAEDGEAEEVQAPEAGESVPREMSEQDIAELASQIEFSPIKESDSADDAGQVLDDDLEIVSPFATMLSNISISNDTDSPESEATENKFSGFPPDVEPEMLDSEESVESVDSVEETDPEDGKKKANQ
jgi:tetratricopeptide (TPR) repeat protein